MHTVTANLPPPAHHVFVDFENVHTIEPAMIGNTAVSFTLLMGPRQTKLDATLVEQLLEHYTSVQLVRLATAGKNALDFTLAYYVGRAVAADPTGFFHIVSRDKGYDPLVAHLRSKHIHVLRHNDFAALASSSSPAVSIPPVPPPSIKLKAPPKPNALPHVLSEQATQVLMHLNKVSTTRPRTQKKFISYLIAYRGHKITDADAMAIIEELRQHRQLAIDEKGAVTYQSGHKEDESLGAVPLVERAPRRSQPTLF
jgi:PIN domain-containing protein